MKQHPHIDIITAWYNGATIQFRRDSMESWQPLNNYRVGCEAPAFDPKYQYRIKPKTFTLVLNEDEMDALNKAIHYYKQAEGDDDSIDSLKAKHDEAEKNA